MAILRNEEKTGIILAELRQCVRCVDPSVGQQFHSFYRPSVCDLH